jgi:hypothetical protein
MVSASSQDPSVFGFRIRSQEPLRFLRFGGGMEALEIVTAQEPRQRPETEPLADWMLGGAGQEARATLYRVERGFEFWATDAGAFHIDPERGRIEVPDITDAIVREQRLWGIPSMLCYQHRGDFSLHAAAVELGGGAVVLGAPSRFGKTTLALAFHRHGHRVLSEDLSCCRAGPVPELIPGPAVLRVRPDVFAGQAVPGLHVVKARPDRVFLGFDADRAGSGDPVPMTAIVLLRETRGGPRLERAAPSAAMRDLWALNFRLQTSEARARSFGQLARLAGAVPIWNLYRPLRLEDLDDTVDLLAEAFPR